MRLEEARDRLGLPWEVIERDYLLSWLLAGINQVASLRRTLVFNCLLYTSAARTPKA